MPASLKRVVPPWWEGGGEDRHHESIVVDDVRPLPDLALNFDIDIGPYLREYLEWSASRRSIDDDVDDIDDIDDDIDDEVGGTASVRTTKMTTTTTTTTTTQQAFATAAMKIQNSATIYDRKVEYLHRAAYVVLDELARNSSFVLFPGGGGRRRGEGLLGGSTMMMRDPDVAAFRMHDPELDFLPLDDVLPVDRSVGRHGIDLPPAADAGKSSSSSSPHNNGGGHRDDVVALFSLGGMMSAPRSADPYDSTPPECARRCLLDGASPSVMTRALLANLLGGHGADVGGGGDGGGEGGGGNRGVGGNLRLVAGTCDVGPDGALLLPGTVSTLFVNGEERDVNVVVVAERRTISSSSSGRDGAGGGDGENARPSSPGNDASRDFGEDDSGGAVFESNYHDDDHDGGVGFEFHDDGDVPDDSETRIDASSDGDRPRSTTMEEDDERRRPREEGFVVVPKDPWATLDPHEPSNDRPRPVRIGITYRLPPGMNEDDRPSSAVTGSRTRTAGRVTSTAESRDPWRCRPYLADIAFDGATRHEGMGGDGGDGSGATMMGGRRPMLPRPGALIFGDEFAYVARANARRRREAVGRRGRPLEGEGEGGGAIVGTNDVPDFDDDENDDYGGGWGGGFDYDGCDDDYGVGRPDIDDPNDGANGSIHRSNVDFNAIGDVFAHAGNAGRGGGRFDDDDGDRPDHYEGDYANDGRKTFEELCRAHLRKFAKSAEIYAAETQLTKRVGHWQAGLAPLLEAQEERPEFDIHRCGRQILEKMERSISVRKRTATGEKRLDSSSGGGRNNVVGFSTIVAKDCEDYEVCRLFLSTLMLCNCGNIAVQKTGDGDDVGVVDSIEIELLNSTFQPPMESFFAAIEDNVHQKENVASSNLGMIDENYIVAEE